MAGDAYGGNEGGFGGLGIGNPGSYGGDQSTVAPGFERGYSNVGMSSWDAFWDKAKRWAAERAPQLASAVASLFLGPMAGLGAGLATKLVQLGLDAQQAQNIVSKYQNGEITAEQAGQLTNKALGIEGTVPIGVSPQEASILLAQAYDGRGGESQWSLANTILDNFQGGNWKDLQGTGAVEQANNFMDMMVNPNKEDNSIVAQARDFVNAAVNPQYNTNQQQDPNMVLDLSTGKLVPQQDQYQSQSQTNSGSIENMWDDFVDRWYGVAPYENTAAREAFNKYFDTAQPGQTQEWAGGTLTMGADGQAQYVSPTGQVVNFNRNSSMEELYNNNPGIAQAWDQAFPSQSAEDIIKGHTGYLGEQAGNYTGLLNQMVSDAQNGAGMFKPASFMLGDQTYSYVPRMNRELADQIAGLGKNIYSTANVTSPFAGDFAYLTAMQPIAQQDWQHGYLDRSLAQSGDLGNRQLDQNEPGILDYLTGINNLFGSNGMFGSNGLFGG